MNAAGTLWVCLWFTVPEPPPLADADRFPDHRAALARADERLAWVKAQRALDLVYPEYWEARREEARAARQPWYELALAQTEYERVSPGGAYGRWHPEAWRRRRLADLRDLIGTDAYERGEIPQP